MSWLWEHLRAKINVCDLWKDVRDDVSKFNINNIGRTKIHTRRFPRQWKHFKAINKKSGVESMQTAVLVRNMFKIFPGIWLSVPSILRRTNHRAGDRFFYGKYEKSWRERGYKTHGWGRTADHDSGQGLFAVRLSPRNDLASLCKLTGTFIAARWNFASKGGRKTSL